MPYARLQGDANGNFSDLGVTATYPGNLSSGSFQTLAVLSSGAVEATISGSPAQVWVAHPLNPLSHGAGHSMWLYHCVTDADDVGTAPTVTIDFVDVTLESLAITEWSGIDTANPIDGTNYAENTGIGATATAGPTGAAGGDDYLGLAAIGVMGSSSIDTYSGFTLADEITAAGGRWALAVVHKEVDSATLSVSSGLSTAFDNWGAMVALYKVSGGAPAPSYNLRRTGIGRSRMHPRAR